MEHLLPQNNANHAAPMKATMKRRQSGFSMIEILVVMGIGMILIAMAVPLVSTTLNMYRLRGAGAAYSNLLQTRSMAAERSAKDYPAYAVPDTQARTESIIGLSLVHT